MNYCTVKLVEEFNAYTGYTQSDEITLYIPSLTQLRKVELKEETGFEKELRKDYQHIYNGRVQKIASLFAAYCSVKFNEGLKEVLEAQGLTEKFRHKLNLAYFDARVYGVEDESEVVNSFLWRVRDPEKNSKNVFAQTYCSHKELQNKTSQEQIEHCKNKTGKDWFSETTPGEKFGRFVKREEVLVQSEGRFQKNGETFRYNELVPRTRIAVVTVNKADFKEVENIVEGKYLES